MGPSVKINQQLLIDYIHEAISLIDPIVHSPEELRLARSKLVELSQIVTSAPMDSKNNLPGIGIRKD